MPPDIPFNNTSLLQSPFHLSLCLQQCSSGEDGFAPRRYLEISEDISDGRSWTGDAATGIAWTELRDATKHLTMQGTSSHDKVLPGPTCQG